jgi:hypothetical protein
MVYLFLAVFFAGCGFALAHLTRKPDPHHLLAYSVLPMLDIERTAGTRIDWTEILHQPIQTDTPKLKPTQAIRPQARHVLR